MHKYVIKRLLYMNPVLLGVAFLVFTILSLTPGDPGSIILGITAKPEDIAALNAEFGYDQPFLVRFFNYIGDIIFHFSLGTSYQTRQPVIEDIMARFPNTLLLTVFSMSIASILGISLGILSAVKQYSVLDHTLVVVALIFASIPGFWLGLMLMLLFSLKLHWLPSYGAGSLKHFILPTLTVCMGSAAGLLRLTRSAMLETVRQEYIRTAKAKGASPKRIIWKHALRNALLPVVTTLGTSFGRFPWRRHYRGDRFCHARYGNPDHHSDPSEGYSGGYGRNVVPRDPFQPDHPRRGCALRLHRSQNQGKIPEWRKSP